MNIWEMGLVRRKQEDALASYLAHNVNYFFN